MRIISRKTLKEFWDLHPDSEQQLKTWFKEVKNAEWENINMIKTEFPSLSILKGNRFVFNIKGNHYRNKNSKKLGKTWTRKACKRWHDYNQ